MPIKGTVDNSGEVALGRDNTLFEPGTSDEVLFTSLDGLREIQSHPDLQVTVTENTEGLKLPSGVTNESGTEGSLTVTPEAESLAAAFGITNLSTIVGTGPGGQIEEQDVENEIERRRAMGLIQDDDQLAVTTEDEPEAQEEAQSAPEGVQDVVVESGEGEAATVEEDSGQGG